MEAAAAVDILAFGAHPDDVELAASGTLIKAARAGARTGVISLTRGEMGTRGTPEARAAEFAAAAEVMGLCHHEMLSLPDGRLHDDEPSREAVIREIREHRPRIVLLPHWEDRHPDHPATSRIVESAAFLAGLAKRDTGQATHRPAALLFYMSTWEFEPSFVVDVSDVIEEKQRALDAYRTQVYQKSAAGVSSEPPTFIASEHFRELILSRMAHYGHLIGKKYGEPFMVRGTLEVTDLLQAFGNRTF
ncbi:MAG TPA: bacillithiol biosynthesis deacetylase BshB1 [Spirochaetia bacterium]|nr:bacillithiol biosynthesis deacetylase BshB1 [Spirochaetia bacterium]HTZ53361.1 bacillithiol biosynthesis deacetylase BshB1 [Spirochaetia bacterium]